MSFPEFSRNVNPKFKEQLQENNIKKDVKLNNLKIHKNKREQNRIDKNKMDLINDNVTNCLTKMNENENEILFQGFNKLDYKFNKNNIIDLIDSSLPSFFKRGKSSSFIF